MEYKNMRKLYKGNICQIGFSNYEKYSVYNDAYLFKFNRIKFTDSNKEYIFIKEGCYLYEIISGCVFPFFISIDDKKTYGITRKFISELNYAIIDNLCEAQLIEVEEYVKKMLIKNL